MKKRIILRSDIFRIREQIASEFEVNSIEVDINRIINNVIFLTIYHQAYTAMMTKLNSYKKHSLRKDIA